MFDHMPKVSKGKLKIQSPQQKRLPWLIGVAGCLVLLVCAALAGVGAWYMFYGPGSAVAQQAGGPSTAATPAGVPSTPVSQQGSRGKIAYSVDTGDRPEDKQVWVVNADGTGARVLLERASSPAFSPDGSLIAYYHWNDGIYVANSDGTNPRKIVGESHAKYLAWSRDGKRLAFSSQPTQRGNVNIDAVLADGSQRHTLVIGGTIPSWSPDGKELVFQTCRGADCGIFKASVPGGAAIQIAGDLGGAPAWSPDGRLVAYHADTDTVKQLFIINANGTGRKQITAGTDLHIDPEWSPDGSWIYYRSPEGGSWGIWRINPDGTGAARVAETGHPVDWAYERLTVSK